MAEVKILDDATIAAIATPAGEGGIHLLRLSGKKALLIASQVFHFSNPAVSFETLQTNQVHFGFLFDGKTKVDEGMLAFFKAPKTYTCEDVVEITVHGNYLLANRALRLFLKYGARLAEAGEFTKRAFLNGRLDLAQAEAVFDLIAAKTELACQVALGQLEGKLTTEIHRLKDQVVDLLAEVEAFVDFPEEDIEVYSNPKMFEKSENVLRRLTQILDSYEKGEILREGIQTAIVGKPNVGKSSLLNTLLGRDRAIVSDIPGTTRDSLEELLEIEGILFRIVDTAGIRKDADVVEKLGIERTKKYLDSSRLVLLVLDRSRPLEESDHHILKELEGKEFLILLNKCDLPAKIDKLKLESDYKAAAILEISSLNKDGIEALEKKLVSQVWKGNWKTDDIVLASQRQYAVLLHAKEAMEKAQNAFRQKLSLEFLAFDLREALDALGEVTGEVYSDDILGVIFSKFCIGK